jgi:hypothetical protein
VTVVRASIVVAPDTAARAADLLTRELRRSASYDTGLAALVVDLTAVALGDDETARSWPDPDGGITVDAYARTVGLTPGAIRKRIRSGHLEARKEHGRWRIRQRQNEPAAPWSTRPKHCD